ncbi:hypothetical protein CCY99_04175 [Helicobacter sp. 16-1353]|uniref:CCA tRNA nucleotidyltransferase n=1 Tax=Helicobacter sp. 16-1353 TaxID=2004996 RepID=UPI000DCB8137|nr:CCA tRNA nucleotidyltransferase [Helicobacter sp. 16-1353]RAX54215.1 hypothetical protein CCY99_04175 [Helicobacter sp. 16-1353]
MAQIFFKNGYRLFLVGGCVRDFALDIIPNDFDLASAATPNTMIEILSDYKIFRNGEQYGTIGVIIDEIKFEITTFRSEDNYIDNRHPNNIFFQNSILEDLKRRDFTINALAYDILDNKIIDEFNGILDISNGILHCVGNPNDRFVEDSLRILRAFAFCSRFDLNLCDDVLTAIKTHKHLLEYISMERIRNEIIKILEGKNPKKALKIMRECDICEIVEVLPKNINLLHCNSRIYFSFLFFKNIDFLNIRLKEKIYLMQEIFTRLITPKTFKKREILLSKLSFEFGLENLEYALKAKSKLNKNTRKLKKAFKKDSMSKKINLKINGYDLINLGISAKNIGQIKQNLAMQVLENHIKNQRISLLKEAKILIDLIEHSPK